VAAPLELTGVRLAHAKEHQSDWRMTLHDQGHETNPLLLTLSDGNNIKACMAVYILEKEREHIGSIWSTVTFLVSCLLLLKGLYLVFLNLLEQQNV
jgi:hypothetical protein